MLSVDEKFRNGFKKKNDGEGLMQGAANSPTDKSHYSTSSKMILPLLSEIKLNEKCHCCPYGYHIDLDFVRYCEALASGTYLRQLKLLKRSRRRQRKSIEAMLSSQENQHSYPDVQSHSQKVDSASGPPPDLVNTSEALRDALKEAMLDFEETYQKSEHPRTERDNYATASSPALPTIDLLTGSNICHHPVQGKSQVISPSSESKSLVRPNHLFNPADIYPSSLVGSRSRSGSASSLTSSISTVSSYADHFPVSMPTLPSQQMADTMATFTNSFLAPTNTLTASDASVDGTCILSPSVVSMNKSTLQSIREQMATSLRRMRELEDHVKNIPILQVKLSVLKEEKRLLMLQLKSKASKHNQRTVGVGVSPSFDMSVDEMGQRLDRLGAMGITSPRPRRKMLSENRTRSRSESPVFRNKSKLIDLSAFHSHQRSCLNDFISPEDEICSLLEKVPKTDLCLRETKNVGVNCSVLTRDVGVSHVLPPSKSVAVGIDFDISTSKLFSDSIETKNKKNIEEFVCHNCSSEKKKSFTETSVNTNISSPLKKLSRSSCRIESFPPHPCEDCEKKRLKPMMDASISTDLLESADAKKLSTDKLTYSEFKKELIDSSVNTLQIPTVNCSTNTNLVNMYNSFTNTDLYMDDVISREEYDSMISLSTSASLCLEPELRDRSIQTVGILEKVDRMVQVLLEDFSLTAVPVQSKRSSRNIGISTQNVKCAEKGTGGNSVLEVVCDRCKGIGKRTIGVGHYAVADVLCDRCANKYTRSVASGEHRISDVFCQKCAAKKYRTIACGSASIFDDFCKRCDNLKTSSIGVGNLDVKLTSCESCLQKLKGKNIGIGTSPLPQKKSVQTNTTEPEKVKDIPGVLNGSIYVCDKCNNTIHSLASDFVQKGTPSSSIPPPLPSRIPRLSIPSADTVVSTSTTVSTTTVTQFGKGNLPSKTSSSRNKLPTAKLEKHQKSSESRISYLNKSFEKFLSSKDDEGLDGKTKLSSKIASSAAENAVSSDEGESSDSSDSESSDSPDEGSYDGVYGNIVHTCHDDEAIRQGLPGASMFHPIQQDKTRPKHIIQEDIKKACKILNEHLLKRSSVSTKDLNSSINLIQQDWFRISSQKGADARLVEDYMDSFEDMSHELLDKIVNLSDANGNTSMHYAVSHGNFDVVSLLLDSKVCDVNKQNKAGYTCIMLASLTQIKEGSDRSVLQRLFKLGDINVKASQHGQTALMLAVSHGRLDVVKMLLHAGADVNIQDEDGSTALMCASEHGHVEIVRALLSHPDCDPTLKDNDNCTALTIAMEAGHKDVGVLIYAHTSFSRGSSPLSSLRVKKRTSSSSSTPPSRTPPPPSPASSRKSTMSVP